MTGGDEVVSEHNALVQFFQRSTVVVVCGLTAASVPNFALAMGFMGSLTLALLTFIFPCTFLLKMHGPRLDRITKVCCCLVIVAGILGSIAGIGMVGEVVPDVTIALSIGDVG